MEADTALREAHRKFARIVSHTSLPELGWGCDGPDCEFPSTENVSNVEPIRAAA
ncbi:MAG: hypothetical protein WDN24_07450 [Sphingomonas sp.]